MANLIVSLILLAAAGAPVDVGDVEKSFQAPDRCSTGAAFDGNLLWVADRKSDRIYAVDLEDGAVQKELEAPGYRPTGLAFDGTCLWAADREMRKAFRIDPATGIAMSAVELDMGRPEGLAFDGAHLWCVDGREKTLTSLDPEDGTTIRSFPAPSAYPTGLAFDGAYLWVADRVADALYRVDPKTGAAVMRLPSPGPYPYGLAPVPGGLLCADYQKDTVDRIALTGSRKALVTRARKARLEFTLDLINFGPGTVETADFYVAVPSNGDNQELLHEAAFEPAPADYTTDQWGQRFAHFRFDGVAPLDRVRAVMHLDVVLKDVRYLLFPEQAGTIDDIPPEVKKRYLVDGSKYDLKNEYILKTAREIVGDERNVVKAVRKIYDYVTDHIEYEMVGGWNTAATVLKRGTGSCSEYTFSFIALCRAAGIPARYAGSLVIRKDDASFDDVFHRWAEVYIPRYGWIPYDPSRGDKKLQADRLQGVGWIANSLLITTRGGGGSKYLGWTYNGDMKWTSKGKCTVRSEQIAEWEPLPEGPKE